MAPDTDRTPIPDATGGITGFQKFVVGLLSVVLVGSIGVRAMTGGEARATQSSGPVGAQSLTGTSLVQMENSDKEEPTPLETYLPYVTEASFFGLIGFALGYTSRKIFKLALILVALGFVAVQGMVFAGWIEVDWGGVIQRLNDWVFNLKQNASVTEFLTDRVPSAGGLLLGWIIGFKRG